MSQHRDDWLSEDLTQVEEQKCKAIYHKTLLVQKYLQNPFSIAWAKMAALLEAVQPSQQAEVDDEKHFEESAPVTTEYEDLYPSFIERVDPSLYYIILFYNRF